MLESKDQAKVPNAGEGDDALLASRGQLKLLSPRGKRSKGVENLVSGSLEKGSIY
jgi:hypothetical protein